MTRKEGSFLPRNIDAEASILGGILLRNDVLALVDTLEVDDFFDHKHKVVFQAVRNLESAKVPIDIVTLENEIAKAGKLEAVGGVAFLGELTLKVPTADNVVAYAKIVRDHRITREVRLMIGEVLTEAETDGVEGEQLVHDVTVALLSVATGQERPIYTMGQLITAEAERVRTDVEARLAGSVVFAGVPTGITELDEKTGGHPRGVPTVYIARPMCGKTTLAMNLAMGSKRLAGVESLLATYEDGLASFGQRGLGQESQISTELLRARRVSEGDLDTIAAAVTRGQVRTEGILPAAGMSAEALVRRVRRENLVRRHRGQAPYGQLIVDYIQKMPMPQHAKSRDEGLTHIGAVLSAFAQDEDIALVILAQLNREVERRDDKIPKLSDIRDSGSIEQDGKLIIALHRPWLYEPNKKDSTGKLVYTPNMLNLWCLKNHQGEAMWTIPLWWDVATHTICNSQLDHGAARNATRTAVHEQQRLSRDDGDLARRFDEAPDWHHR